jgi:transposase-like protein
MARAGPRKVARYGDQFKATAVKLSSLRGVMIKDVAAALISDVEAVGKPWNSWADRPY